VPQAQIELQYEDRSDVLEQYVDDLEIAILHGDVARFVFTVTRIDLPIQEGKPATGKKIPTLRLIMPSASLKDLARKINEIAGREVARA
jgi:hypothetical protein